MWDAIVQVQPEGVCALSWDVRDRPQCSTSVRLSRLHSLISRLVCLLSLCEVPLEYPSECSTVQCPSWYIDVMHFHGYPLAILWPR